MPSGDVSHYQWATVINVGSISFNLRFDALLSAWLIFKGTLAGFLSQPPPPPRDLVQLSEDAHTQQGPEGAI